MGERKIALTPNVVVPGALGPKNYGILITNERSLFILQRSSKAMIGGILGGAISAAVMESVAAEKEVDYLHEQVEMLAAMKGTISVSHASLLSILMEKTLSAYNLRIDYSESGRKRKIKAILTPPGTLLLQELNQGKNKKDILREYVEEVSRAFEKALPPEVALKVQVRI